MNRALESSWKEGGWNYWSWDWVLANFSEDKGRMTLVKLLSTAKTGYLRYVMRPRSSPIVRQVRYDPIGKLKVWCLVGTTHLTVSSTACSI